MHRVEAHLLEDLTVGDSLGQQILSLNEPQCLYMEVFASPPRPPPTPSHSAYSENIIQPFAWAAGL